MTDKRLFKASEIDSARAGWVADLSGPRIVNPDAYFFFKSKSAAANFLALIDSGLDSYQAKLEIERRSDLAAGLGSIGGASTSPAKRAASAANGKRGGRPRKSSTS